MRKVNQYKNVISAFITSENGQRFFNFAYSIGAAIVIWGALFKILHLPGGNTLLCIGMGTEVLMFVLTAFDRPPREYKWEEVFPVLDTHNEEDRPEMNGGAGGVTVVHSGVPAGVTAGEAHHAAETDLATENARQLSDSIAQLNAATREYTEQMTSIAAEMNRLRDTTRTLNRVSDILLESYQAITQNSEAITSCSRGYVDQMQSLHRNISGLNTIYEIQLKSVSSQIDSIDRVNRGIKDIRDMYEKSAQQSSRYCEETEKMTRYMQQLNSVYEKMITAMTVNMYRPGGMPDMTPTQEK